MVRGSVHRVVVLQNAATERKLGALRKFSTEAASCADWMLNEKAGDKRLTDLWAKLGAKAKKSTGFNSQVICDLVRTILRTKGQKIKRVTVKFNVPRNCKTFKTKEFFFVELGMYPRRRVAIPILRNRNLDRFFGLLGNGWTCKTFGLTSRLGIAAYLSKKEAPSTSQRNVLGIDINAKDFAYTILTPEGEIMKQGYLGQQIWVRKKHFEERRALLRSLNALKKLKQMRHRQRNYVRTNIGQLVREIMLLAKEYKADISIERLSRFKSKGRRFNRKVMTIPFAIFRRILEGRCFDNGLVLNKVDAYHTSKWCSRCGAVGRGHDGRNYALFRCNHCGLTVNADRKASLAVAVKSLLERNSSPNQSIFQISRRRVPVSGLIRTSPMIRGRVAVPMPALERGKRPV